MNNNEIKHHGIKGMKWGVRRFQDKSGRRTSAGEQRYSNGKTKKQLTPEEKKAKRLKYAKIGGAVAVAAIGAYVGYKLYKNKNAIFEKADLEFARQKMVHKMGKKNMDYLKSKDVKAGNIDLDIATGFKKISGGKESPAKAALNACPKRGTEEMNNGCVANAIAAFFRSNKGLDVVSKGTGGKMLNSAGTLETIFKKPRIIQGSAVTFGKSKNDAANMLKRKFGDDAEGICSVELLNKTGRSSGHAFNWKIKDGIVEFSDSTMAFDDSKIGVYFKRINRQGNLVLARLDDVDFDLNELKKYVE